ncbi:hypothetical protein JCM8115_005912 [Rhodotorula mucilaginosa]
MWMQYSFEARLADPLRSSQDSRPSAGDYHPSQSQSPPGSILPSYLTPDSSRANSFDRARAGSPYSQVNSVGSNPFRDPSLDWVRGTSFENDAHSILSSAASESANENGGYRPSPGERRPSEVQRDLSSAVADELPRISEDSLSPPREYTPPPSSTATPKTGSTSKKGGLLHQFRTGSGWFAPLVEPEAPLSQEERAAAEKARIEKLKDGRASTSARRPGLMKRMSSGVEMGFKNRDRSGSTSTITGNNR